MKRATLWIAGLILALFTAAALAEEALPREPVDPIEQRYLEAVRALQDEEPQSAARLLRELRAHGVQTAGLEYNLGLAERALDRPAHARAAFERALSAHPRDLLARRNLRALKAELSEEVAELDVPGALWWTRSELAVASVLIALGGFGWSWRARRRGAVAERRNSSLWGPVSLLVFGQAATLGLWLWSPAPSELAISTLDRAPLLQAPDSDRPFRQLPLGVRLKIGPEQGHLIQVELGDGTVGWIRRAQVAPLQLPLPSAPSAEGN